MLEADARLIRKFRARSRNQACQKMYDFMGWGHYTTWAEEMRLRAKLGVPSGTVANLALLRKSLTGVKKKK